MKTLSAFPGRRDIWFSEVGSAGLRYDVTASMRMCGDRSCTLHRGKCSDSPADTVIL